MYVLFSDNVICAMVARLVLMMILIIPLSDGDGLIRAREVSTKDVVNCIQVSLSLVIRFLDFLTYY